MHPTLEEKSKQLTCSAEATGGALAMVTRLPSRPVGAAESTTTPRLGSVGSAIVPLRPGSALSHSSSGLVAVEGGTLPLEESLLRAINQHIQPREGEKKTTRKKGELTSSRGPEGRAGPLPGRSHRIPCPVGPVASNSGRRRRAEIIGARHLL